MIKIYSATDEEYKNELNLFKNSGFGLIKYMEKSNFDRKSTVLAWKRLNLDLPKGMHKIKVNENYFSEINNQNKAYALGLFASDGYMTEDKKIPCRVNWKFNIKDREMIDWLNNETCNKTGGLYIESKDIGSYLTLSFISRPMCQDLIKHGFGPRKTKNINYLPDIPKHLLRHFIRGYFDGDGHVSCGDKSPLQFGITSFNRKILEEIKKILPEDISCGIHTRTRQEFVKYGKTFKKSTNSALYCANQLGCFRMYQYLYEDANFYLQRKHDKFEKGLRAIGLIGE